MLATDRDALLCDLAETYRIYDFNALPVSTLAALAFGLRENSRIKRMLNGLKEVDPLFILASIADNLAILRSTVRGLDASEEHLFLSDIVESKPEAKDSASTYRFASSEEFKEIWYG